MANEKTTYSYSRLTTYQNCEMEYYLNYILKCDGESNIYAEVGYSGPRSLRHRHGGGDEMRRGPHRPGRGRWGPRGGCGLDAV